MYGGDEGWSTARLSAAAGGYLKQHRFVEIAIIIGEGV